VIIAGYVVIICGVKGVCKKVRKERGRGEKRGKEKDIEWKDIGKEFKRGLYNLGVIFRKSLEPKKKKGRKKSS
jgi:hypothetical protein